jgi:hypothetical protein
VKLMLCRLLRSLSRLLDAVVNCTMSESQKRELERLDKEVQLKKAAIASRAALGEASRASLEAARRFIREGRRDFTVRVAVPLSYVTPHRPCKMCQLQAADTFMLTTVVAGPHVWDSSMTVCKPCATAMALSDPHGGMDE